jgi:hypothetical protein
MKQIHFSARLVSDAVISERSATTGGHRSLDYIPGACLLGASAARLYADLGDRAFEVFHSGKVRFGNAYPLDGQDRPTWPVPLAWHYSKGEDLKKKVDPIKNLLHAKADDFARWDQAGDQQKQLRSGFFSTDGHLVQPAKRYRLKTAIDRDNFGAAQEAQLFGYEALAAGSNWYFSVAFDDDLPGEMVERVADSLCGDIRIGRSRSAEYGLLRAQRVDHTLPVEAMAPCTEVILYCASDLALIDQATGVAKLTPGGGDFLLDGAKFSAERSYLRVRSYAPFNATRRRFDLERQVIAKGSVLVFSREQEFSTEELTGLVKRLEGGIGLYRQDGLGRLLVNPPFLGGFNFTPQPAMPALPVPQPKKQPEPPPLAAWLADRATAHTAEIIAVTEVERWISDLVAGSCPKNSQWGNLRNLALRSSTADELRKKVQKLCSEGVSQKQWEKTFRMDGKKISYGKFIQDTVLAPGVDLETARKRLYLLGNRLPRRSNQKNGGDQ